MRVLVIGAGLTGSVLAERLASEKGCDVDVVDIRNHVAGNCFDYRDDDTGILVYRYGPHIFHTNDRRVFSYLSRFTDWHNYYARLEARIDGVSVPLPIGLSSFFRVFPDSLANRVCDRLIAVFGLGSSVSILDMRKSADTDIRMAADYLYDKVFRPYYRKQWECDPEDLDASVASRVPIRISMDSRCFTDKYQAIPLHGYTQMVELMLASDKIHVSLGIDYRSIQTGEYSRIYCTAPIDEYFGYEFGELGYRSLRFDIRHACEDQIQPVPVVSYPGDYDFTRICEHRHFLPQCGVRGTVYSVEYPERFVAGKNERFYPIPSEEQRERYLLYAKRAADDGRTVFAGRLGSYRYLNMDQAVAAALDLPL